jgi:hypothetical protein
VEDDLTFFFHLDKTGPFPSMSRRILGIRFCPSKILRTRNTLSEYPLENLKNIKIIRDASLNYPLSKQTSFSRLKLLRQSLYAKYPDM